MTQIKGNQIVSGSVSFDVFPKDAMGNITLPAGTLFAGQPLLTQSALDAISVGKKVEKVSADDNGDYIISAVQAGDVVVSVNGVVQTPGDDYSMDGQTIKFETAPSSDDVVVASYIVFSV